MLHLTEKYFVLVIVSLLAWPDAQAGMSVDLQTPTTQANEQAKNIQRKKPQIEKIVQDISAKRIEVYINRLVGFGTRHSMSDTISDTAGIGAVGRQRVIKRGVGAVNVEEGMVFEDCILEIADDIA